MLNANANANCNANANVNVNANDRYKLVSCEFLYSIINVFKVFSTFACRILCKL